MKLNKKGFTLVELLAVIVILAIIMLIATPSILNIIGDARKGAARSSAMGYINAIEKEAMAREVTENSDKLMNATITDPDLIPLRGQAPKSVDISISNGTVVSGFLIFGDYVFEVNNDGTVSLVD